MDLFANTSIPSLEIALSGLAQRQTSIGENLANVSVPAYKSQHTSFENNLQQALAHHRKQSQSLTTTDEQHMQIGVNSFDTDEIVETSTDLDTEIHSAGNNVDIDAEMVNLAKTGLQYRAATQMARRQIDQLRSVIRGAN